MAILGSVLSVGVIFAGAVALDLSRLSTAKTELTQILQSACENAASVKSSGENNRRAELAGQRLASSAFLNSRTLAAEGTPTLQVAADGTVVTVEDQRGVELFFGKLTGAEDASVSAAVECPVPAAPINMDDPVAGCSGDAIRITNATRFSADADTAEALTSSRLISVAVVDSAQNLLERVLVGDGGEPSYERTSIRTSDVIIIQPVVAGAVMPVVCIPTTPTGGGGGGPGGPGGPGSGSCLTAPTSGSAAGNELGFDTNGTYQGFFTESSGAAAGVANDGSSATSSGYLDGDGIITGSAAVGDGSSSSCVALVSENANGTLTSEATGENTNTDTSMTSTDNGDGSTTVNGSGNCNASNGNSNSNGRMRGRGQGSQVTMIGSMECN